MSGKIKILIQKLPKTKSGIQRYRVTKLINTRRLNLMEQDYEEDELQQMLCSLPMTFDYQINNTMPKGKR
tara:strand:- start:187 stop:396 length:210 start_codon:yes stop_codon:yes gene_type:complete